MDWVHWKEPCNKNQKRIPRNATLSFLTKYVNSKDTFSLKCIDYFGWGEDDSIVEISFVQGGSSVGSGVFSFSGDWDMRHLVILSEKTGIPPPDDPNDLTPVEWNYLVDNGTFVNDPDNRRWLYNGSEYCPYFGIDTNGEFHFGTAYTASQAGLFDAVATWGGGGFPATGDTWDTSTYIVTIQGTEASGSGTVTSGGTLRFDGQTDATPAILNLDNGATLANSGTVDSTGTGSTGYAGINGVSAEPFTGTAPSLGSGYWKVGQMDFQMDITTGGGGCTFEIVDDITHDAITVSNNDELKCTTPGVTLTTVDSKSMTNNGVLNFQGANGNPIIWGSLAFVKVSNAVTSDITLDWVNITSGYGITYGANPASNTVSNIILTEIYATRAGLEILAGVSVTGISSSTFDGGDGSVWNRCDVIIYTGATLELDSCTFTNGNIGMQATSGWLVSKDGSSNFTIYGILASSETPSAGYRANDITGDLTLSNADAYSTPFNTSYTLGANAVNIDACTVGASCTFDTDSGNDYSYSSAERTSVDGTFNCNGSTCQFGASTYTTLYGLEMDGTFNGGDGNHTASTINCKSGTCGFTSGTTEITGIIAGNISLVFQTAPTHNNGTITFTDTANQYFWDTSNTARTIYNLTINKASGTVQHINGGGFALTVANNLTITAGEFDTSETVTGTSRDLTVTNQTQIGAGTLTLNASTVSLGSGYTAGYALSMGHAGGGSCNMGSATVTVGSIGWGVGNNATVTLTSGVLTIDSARSANDYSFWHAGTTDFINNSGTITFTKNGTQLIGDNANRPQTLYNVILNGGASQTVQYVNGKGYTTTISNNLTISQGEFDTSDVTGGTSRDLTVTNNTSITGTLTLNGSTVSLQATTINDGGTLANDTATTDIDGALIIGGGASGLLSTGAGSLDINSTTTINTGATLGTADTAYTIDFGGTVNTSTGTFIAPNASGHLYMRAGYTWNTPTTYTHSSGKMTFLGSGTVTIGNNSTQFYDVDVANFTTVAISDKSFTCDALDIGGGVSGIVTVTTGTITLNGPFNVGTGGSFGSDSSYTLDMNGNMNSSNGTFEAPDSGGTFTFSGTTFRQVNTYNHNDGLITFDKAGTSTLSTNPATFYDMSISAGAELDTGADISLTADNLTSVSGTLTCNDSTISLGSGVTGSYSVALTGTLNGGSGAHTYGTIQLSGFGVWVLTSNTTTIDSRKTTTQVVSIVGAPTINHSNGTLTLTQDLGNAQFDMRVLSHPFYNVIINTGATRTTYLYDNDANTLSVANNLTISQGILDTKDASGIHVGLTVTNLTSNYGTLTCNSSTIGLGSGLSGSTALYHYTGTFNGGDGVHTYGSVRIDNGTFNATSNTTTIDGVGGAVAWFAHISGTFNHSDGTFENTGAASRIYMVNGDTFYNLTQNNASSWSPVLSGGTLNIANNFTITQGGVNTKYPGWTAVDFNVTNITSIAGTLTCNASTMSLGSGYSGNPNYAVTINENGTFNGGSGTHTIGNLSAYAVGVSCTLSSGTTTIDETRSNVDVALFTKDTYFDDGNGTLVFTKTGTQEIYTAGDDLTLYNVTVNNASCVLSVYATTFDLTIANNLTITTGELDTDASLNMGLTVTNLTTVSDTLTCNASTISLGDGLKGSGGFALSVGGTVNGGTGDHTYGSFTVFLSSNLNMTTGTTTINGYQDLSSRQWMYQIHNAGVSGGITHNNGTCVIETVSATEDIFFWNTATVKNAFYDLKFDPASTQVYSDYSASVYVVDNELNIQADAEVQSVNSITVTSTTEVYGTMTTNSSTQSYAKLDINLGTYTCANNVALSTSNAINVNGTFTSSGTSGNTNTFTTNTGGVVVDGTSANLTMDYTTLNNTGGGYGLWYQFIPTTNAVDNCTFTEDNQSGLIQNAVGNVTNITNCTFDNSSLGGTWTSQDVSVGTNCNLELEGCTFDKVGMNATGTTWLVSKDHNAVSDDWKYWGIMSTSDPTGSYTATDWTTSPNLYIQNADSYAIPFNTVITIDEDDIQFPASITTTVGVGLAELIWKQPNNPSSGGTIYVDKSGTDLDVGETEVGGDPNGFAYSASQITSVFPRESGDWNGWMYTLGTTLSETNDFFARIWFTTGSSLLATTGTNPYAYFGFCKSTQGTNLSNTLGFYQYCAYDTGGICYRSDATSDVDYEGSTILGVSQNYYCTVSYNGTTKTATIKIYDTTDTLLGTYSVNATGKTLSFDSVGIWGYKQPSGTNGEFAQPMSVTRIKANSGTTELFTTSSTVITESGIPIQVTGTKISGDYRKSWFNNTGADINGGFE